MYVFNAVSASPTKIHFYLVAFIIHFTYVLLSLILQF